MSRLHRFFMSFSSICSNSNFLRHSDAYAMDTNVLNCQNNQEHEEHETHLNKANECVNDDDDKIRVYNFSSSDENYVTYVWQSNEHLCIYPQFQFVWKINI